MLLNKETKPKKKWNFHDHSNTGLCENTKEIAEYLRKVAVHTPMITISQSQYADAWNIRLFRK